MRDAKQEFVYERELLPSCYRHGVRTIWAGSRWYKPTRLRSPISPW